MSGSSTTLFSAVNSIGFQQAKNIALDYANSMGFIWQDGTSVVFEASCCEELSPSFRGRFSTPEQVIIKWVDAYFNDFNNRPSVRYSKPPGTRHDQALDMIIHARLPHLTERDLEMIKWAHRLGMSAENIFGTILEEYLSIRLLPLGWYCAWGSVVKAADFVSHDGQLLQVKSRNNTENSSSNKIRSGTEIKKWWRFHATRGETNWSKLNELIGYNVVSEVDFQNFVLELVKLNPWSMAVESENLWSRNF